MVTTKKIAKDSQKGNEKVMQIFHYRTTEQRRGEWGRKWEHTGHKEHKYQNDRVISSLSVSLKRTEYSAIWNSMKDSWGGINQSHVQRRCLILLFRAKRRVKAAAPVEGRRAVIKGRVRVFVQDENSWTGVNRGHPHARNECTESQ